MAYYDMTQTVAINRLGRMVARLTSSLMAWRDGCATRAALGKLTDHELNDIGLSRGDLDEMSGPFLSND